MSDSYKQGVMDGISMCIEAIDAAIRVHNIEGHAKKCLLETKNALCRSLVNIHKMGWKQ